MDNFNRVAISISIFWDEMGVYILAILFLGIVILYQLRNIYNEIMNSGNFKNYKDYAPVIGDDGIVSECIYSQQ